MIPPQKFTARLEEVTPHTDKFIQYAFELESPHTMVFQAGQYVSLKVAETGERRSYSICSTPAIDHGFELLVDISPQGLGSKFLQNLAIGASVEVLAPLGHFVISDQGEKAIVMVATGSGITPFYSMISDLLQNKKDQRSITLYWGLRYVTDLFWTEELENLAEVFHNFHFYPTLTQPVPEWTLSTGRVTNLLEVHNFEPQTGFYLCGNQSMIDDCQKLLLAKDVASSYIHHESFTTTP